MESHGRSARKGAGMSEWQPISTAPKDTPILATDGKLIIVLMRGTCGGEDWPDSVGFGGYEWEWDFEWKDLTHWMPLPEAPHD